MKTLQKNIIKKNIILSSLVFSLLIVFIITLVYIINYKSIESFETSNTLLLAENVKNISFKIENPVEELEQLEISEIPTNTLSEESKSVDSVTESIPTGSGNYYIKVNLGSNVVTIYTRDSNGDFTIPYKAMICSTGRKTPTSGKYTIKSKWRWLGLFGDVYGQYVTQINGNILFHSVPYTQRGNPASLEYWEYDKLGTSASMGCIRLQVKDTKWIYDNVSRGVTVEFYSSSDPGPLGKPTAQQISSNESCRNWDPTDPSDENPWKNIQQNEVQNSSNTPSIPNVEEDKTEQKNDTTSSSTNTSSNETFIENSNTTSSEVQNKHEDISSNKVVNESSNSITDSAVSNELLNSNITTTLIENSL